MSATQISSDVCDLAVIGAGVVGLAIAWEVSKRGMRVVILEREDAPLPASWAAAGMLPPMDAERARDPLDRLHGLSHQLYPQWVAELEELSSVDVEFQRCGGLRIARTPGEAAALRAASEQWLDDGIRLEPLTPAEALSYEPELTPSLGNQTYHMVFRLPDEGQIRTPRLLTALRRACTASSVEFATCPAAIDAQHTTDDTWSIKSLERSVHADRICFAAGVWTAPLLAEFGVRLELEPRRGQMILLSPSEVRLRGLINEGPRYLVPRRDGRILVGSTVEEVGFNQSTVREDLEGLKDFATGLIPRLIDVPIEASWAGLRPRTGDGYPFLGSIPGLANAYVATGHFRDGIQLAPITGRLMGDLIVDQISAAEITPFRVERE